MIAVIPARGGSKGLIGKNVKILNGKPMIAYTIEEALKSKYITNVIISTDCKEIEKIAIKYGATSLFLRPAYLAADDSMAIDTYLHAIEEINNKFSINMKEVIVLLPTCPLRTFRDIDSAIEIFKNKDADSVISYTEEKHPIQWHKYIQEDGKFENIFKDNILNRQDNKISYYPNGAIFIFKTNLLKEKKYYSKKSYSYIMPNNRSADVDTLEDFEYVEFLMGKKHE